MMLEGVIANKDPTVSGTEGGQCEWKELVL